MANRCRRASRPTCSCPSSATSSTGGRARRAGSASAFLDPVTRRAITTPTCGAQSCAGADADDRRGAAFIANIRHIVERHGFPVAYADIGGAGVHPGLGINRHLPAFLMDQRHIGVTPADADFEVVHQRLGLELAEEGFHLIASNQVDSFRLKPLFQKLDRMYQPNQSQI